MTREEEIVGKIADLQARVASLEWRGAKREDIGLTCERCNVMTAVTDHAQAKAIGWKDVTQHTVPGWLCPDCAKAKPTETDAEKEYEDAKRELDAERTIPPHPGFVNECRVDNERSAAARVIAEAYNAGWNACIDLALGALKKNEIVGSECVLELKK